jgi:hypothetical protein
MYVINASNNIIDKKTVVDVALPYLKHMRLIYRAGRNISSFNNLADKEIKLEFEIPLEKIISVKVVL